MAGMVLVIGFLELKMEWPIKKTFKKTMGFLTPNEQQNRNHEVTSKGLKEKKVRKEWFKLVADRFDLESSNVAPTVVIQVEQQIWLL